MKKKILILILVFSVFVVGLCFGVNTYAWEESDDFEGSPIANGSEFLNMSLTLPSEAVGGEYWYNSPSVNFCNLNFYSNSYEIDFTYHIGVVELEDSSLNHRFFGLYPDFSNINGGYDFDVYYYDFSNVKHTVNYTDISDVNDNNRVKRCYILVDLIGYSGLGYTYYIDIGESYGDLNPNPLTVANLSAKTNYVYEDNQMLYLSSFNYTTPMGTEIGDVISDTFSLGTGILGALASYFNVFALTDGNLSLIAVFGFALLGISLCIGMTRWISSLIRRKI